MAPSIGFADSSPRGEHQPLLPTYSFRNAPAISSAMASKASRPATYGNQFIDASQLEREDDAPGPADRTAPEQGVR